MNQAADEGEDAGVVDPDGKRPELSRTLYDELRKLATARIAREPRPLTLQSTALVHEVWLRLGGDRQPAWANRAQFFSAAAEAMRRILIEDARRRKAVRHGGSYRRVELNPLDIEATDLASEADRDRAILALHDALEALANEDPAVADLVKLKYFAGRSLSEIADLLNISLRTAERRMAFGKAWLSKQIRESRH